MEAFTSEELEAEVARRERAASVNMPAPVANPDFTTLIETVTFGVNEAIKNGYQDKNLEGYVWEAAVEAIYGPSYWTWRRAQRW